MIETYRTTSLAPLDAAPSRLTLAQVVFLLRFWLCVRAASPTVWFNHHDAPAPGTRKPYPVEGVEHTLLFAGRFTIVCHTTACVDCQARRRARGMTAEAHIIRVPMPLHRLRPPSELRIAPPPVPPTDGPVRGVR